MKEEGKKIYINLHCSNVDVPGAELPIHCENFSAQTQPGQLCLEKFSVKPRKRERNNVLSSSHRDVGRLHDFSKPMGEFSDKSRPEFGGFYLISEVAGTGGHTQSESESKFSIFPPMGCTWKKEKQGGYPPQIFSISSVTTTAHLREERNLIVHFPYLN